MERLAGTNTLAYFGYSSITAVKVFKYLPQTDEIATKVLKDIIHKGIPSASVKQYQGSKLKIFIISYK